MTQQIINIVEPDSKYYELYDDFCMRYAQEEEDHVFYTEALSIMEKRLMVEADEQFYAKHNKRLSEALQRRDAKVNPNYIKLVRSKAAAVKRVRALKGKITMLDRKFDEWRTRCANQR